MNDKIGNRDRIAVISSIFAATGIVDIKTDEYELYKMTDNKFMNLAVNGSFSEAKENFLKNIVSPDDVEGMREFLDKETVMERLQKSSNLAKEFMRVDGDFSIMNISRDIIDGKMSDDTFILSLQNSYKDMVKYDNAIKEKDGLEEIFRMLAQSYFYVAIIDLENDYLEIKKSRTSNTSIFKGKKYSKMINLFANVYVDKKDKERFVKETSLEIIKEKLINSSQYKVFFEAKLDEKLEDRYFCLQYVKSDKNPNVVIIGLNSIHETINEKMKTNVLLSALTEDYEYVFFSDIDTNIFKVEKVSEKGKEYLMSLVEKGVPISEVFEKYIEKYVVDEDKEGFRYYFKQENIKKYLNEEESITFHYRLNENEYGLKYFCLHIVSAIVNGRHLAVYGIKNEDVKMKQYLKQKYELERQMKIIGALNNTFETTYHLDLVNNCYDEIKAQDFFHDIAGYHGELFSIIPVIIKSLVSVEDLEATSVFCDVRTLAYRMKNKSTLEYDLIDKNGIWNRISFIESERDKDGEVISVLFTIRIIDEEKVKEISSQRKLDEAYKALSRYQKRIETTLEGAHIGLWSLEIKDGAKPRLICNKTMLDILGFDSTYTPEEADEELRRRIHPDDLDGFEKYSQSLVVEPRSEYVYRWNHPTQGLTYMRCGGWRDRSYTGGLYFRGYHSNVTDYQIKQIEHQERLKHALDEANKANAAKSDFLARISHDIRTPINGINGMLEIIKKNIDYKEKVEDCIDKIQSSSKYLLSLVNDVLSMSKLETGKIELQHVPFDVKQLFEEMHNINQIKAEEIGLKLNSSINVKHFHLLGSPLHIQQIVINLISNSIKYNRPNGSVFVNCEEIDFNGEKAKFRLEVSDTGIGMSKEYLEKIFEPFTQESNDARSRLQGTGLGMSIVKKLVDKMNGTITVDSQKNVGTKFVVEMWIDVEKEKGDSFEKINRKISIDNLRILVVEDNEINMEIIDYLLKEEGAIISKAKNGKEAVEMFRRYPPGTYDVILMDIMMPIMNGLEATMEIRRSDRQDALSIPIIAMTANTFIEEQNKYKEAGMNDFIAKPVNIKETIKLLAKYK